MFVPGDTLLYPYMQKLLGEGFARLFQNFSEQETEHVKISENSRKLGSVQGFPRKTCWKNVPNRKMLQILGLRAPGMVNLPGTLGRHCLDLVPTFRAVGSSPHDIWTISNPLVYPHSCHLINIDARLRIWGLPGQKARKWSQNCPLGTPSTRFVFPCLCFP